MDLLDLFVANFGTANWLYRNNGNGTFTKITSGAIVTDLEYSLGSAWADVDNDGDLDLFVANFGASSSLYLNGGNGTFTKKPLSEIARDFNPSAAVAFTDFDGDGDMDLFITKYVQQSNALFENRGTTNRFLKIRLAGKLSNGAGIGARVRIKTRVNGSEVWQLRQISGGSGSSQEALEANFGIGNAEIVEIVEITWPTGARQTWTNVAANSVLNVVEAPQLSASLPVATLNFSTKAGAPITIETSTDLKTWTFLLKTNAPAADFSMTDPTASNVETRFYRATYTR
jgi:hypothetical protein